VRCSTVRRLAILAALAVLVFPTAGGSARAKPAEVFVQFSAYGPSQLDVLPGQTVLWSNVSSRTHTVTSDTGLFDSDNLRPDQRFTFTFSRPGTYQYHCSIHSSIRGEVDVRSVILDTLPTAAVPVGDAVEFSGRTADPTRPIEIQRSVGGKRFATIARASPRRDGSWSTRVEAQLTGDYRARAGDSTSETRRLLVGIRHVHVRPTKTGISVTVTPDLPYAPILVETYRRDRFGWWPLRRTELDYVSEADLKVRGPVRVRVVLVDKDGWTPIATSKPVSVAGR
jgi:plastocyanin